MTFSHADEARFQLINTKSVISLYGLAEVTFDLMGGLDHGDLDYEYYMNRAKNNAKIVDEVVRLRESRESLREFELDMDNELPSRKKLKEIKALAKEVIENPAFKSRGSRTNEKRDTREEAQLTEKIRDL